LYLVTSPLSQPMMTKSLAATAAEWFSVDTSMIVGSSSEPWSKIRMAPLRPAVTSCRPFGV
jgi:hypothetical protein